MEQILLFKTEAMGSVDRTKQLVAMMPPGTAIIDATSEATETRVSAGTKINNQAIRVSTVIK